MHGQLIPNWSKQTSFVPWTDFRAKSRKHFNNFSELGKSFFCFFVYLRMKSFTTRNALRSLTGIGCVVGANRDNVINCCSVIITLSKESFFVFSIEPGLPSPRTSCFPDKKEMLSSSKHFVHNPNEVFSLKPARSNDAKTWNSTQSRLKWSCAQQNTWLSLFEFRRVTTCNWYGFNVANSLLLTRKVKNVQRQCRTEFRL